MTAATMRSVRKHEPVAELVSVADHHPVLRIIRGHRPRTLADGLGGGSSTEPCPDRLSRKGCKCPVCDLANTTSEEDQLWYSKPKPVWDRGLLSFNRSGGFC